jgi:NADP-dependent 3-hydroxy acid dehydrogenase YdfG
MPKEIADALLADLPALEPKAIADAVIYLLSTPANVLISELTIHPMGETF